ncbi:MAG: hypothetical protein JWN37_307 [Candidatus Nomurabacteria bacterium]|nr:hypothetical protein [Candidatus Nomurabacteria bacterium]
MKKEESKELSEGGASSFLEYNLPFKNISVGISKVNGRYPENGFDVDNEIEQVWYVKDGEGKVGISSEEFLISKGDMVHIPKGEKYFIEGNNLQLVVSSTPPWTKNQHKNVE